LSYRPSAAHLDRDRVHRLLAHRVARRPAVGRCDPRCAGVRSRVCGELLPCRTRPRTPVALRHTHIRREVDGDRHGDLQLLFTHFARWARTHPAHDRRWLSRPADVHRREHGRRLRECERGAERLAQQSRALRGPDQSELPRDRRRSRLQRRVQLSHLLGNGCGWDRRCRDGRPGIRPRLSRRVGRAESRCHPLAGSDRDDGRRIEEHRLPRVVPRQRRSAGEPRTADPLDTQRWDLEYGWPSASRIATTTTAYVGPGQLGLVPVPGARSRAARLVRAAGAWRDRWRDLARGSRHLLDDHVR
jgi:hypothetical protein